MLFYVILGSKDTEWYEKKSIFIELAWKKSKECFGHIVVPWNRFYFYLRTYSVYLIKRIKFSLGKTEIVFLFMFDFYFCTVVGTSKVVLLFKNTLSVGGEQSPQFGGKRLTTVEQYIPGQWTALRLNNIYINIYIIIIIYRTGGEWKIGKTRSTEENCFFFFSRWPADNCSTDVVSGH